MDPHRIATRHSQDHHGYGNDASVLRSKRPRLHTHGKNTSSNRSSSSNSYIGRRVSSSFGCASVASGRSVAASGRSVASSRTASSRTVAARERLRKRHNLGSNFGNYHHHHQSSPAGQSHVLCTIGENLARETCVVSLDLAAPFLLTVTKQSNGQSYSETVACLSVLSPHEVLMNEGRYHSPLARKVVGYFDLQRQQREQHERQCCQDDEAATARSGRSGAAGSSNNARKGSSFRARDANNKDDDGASDTVVKFISRSYFDQTRGAELLKKLARPDTFDATMVDEYILLSSAHALLHYAQATLGAVSLARQSLDVKVYTGGHNHHKMEIDRSTLLQLELLTNNSHCRNHQNRKHSLIATMDCTKTGVGHRLLRTTLMAPPCRLDTITARLDLVDTFLHDEDLFYATLQQLQNLSSLDNMLTNIVVVPQRKQQHLEQHQRKQGLGIATATREGGGGEIGGIPLVSPGKTNAANARIASKGISSLICIKSTLACVPVLASILQRYLDKLDGKSNSTKNHPPETDAGRSTRDEASIATAKSSLLIGLGVGKSPASVASGSAPDQQLLRAIVFALTQPELLVVRETIDQAFTESTTYTRNANAMKHQECFALRSSDNNGMMDIYRKAFLSNVDDIYKKADEYAEVHGISHVAVKYSTARGYYLSLPLEMASNLPNEFIQPSKSGRFIFCTTEEVLSLNTRAQDNITDLLLLTHNRIQEVLDVARSSYDSLARLSDAVALLDLCHGFADKVTLSKLPWTRPSLTDGGKAAENDEEERDSPDKDRPDSSNDPHATTADPSNTAPEENYAIAICNGRYGIDVDDVGLSSDDGPGEWIANDTYASLSKNLTIISGINGSGKSTYLRQIAIIVLLAHCGSYVPAEEALIPLTNRLCARMMTADDQESNISSFMLEMKETAFICKNATSRSLILLDELGRATSNEDGVAIAWAVAESLLAKGAMTYFVTHYPQLCQMSRVYPSVQNQHLKASISDDGDGRIRYSHKIASGPCDATSNYGVDMAISCGWPSDVVKEARSIENSLKDKLAEIPLCGESSDIETEIKHQIALKAMVKRLDRVTTECEPTMDALRSALQALKVSMLEEIPESVIFELLGNNDNEEKTQK